jgi:hypothetical protein
MQKTTPIYTQNKTKEQICGHRTATCNKHYTNLLGLFCFALILVVIQ